MAKKIRLKPLGTRVLLRELKQEDEQGGIVLPEDAEGSDKFRQAEVLAVGAAVGSEDEPIKVAVGDKVLIDSFAGKEIEFDGEELLIVKSTDILAIVS